jgi:class 3 adenylate cyclase
MATSSTALAAFEPYVPRLLAGWTGPPARELDGSLVSLDIAGFTALSERLQAGGRAGAEELVAVISAVFTGLIGISDRYGGDVLKFRGDGLLILFSGSGHAARAHTAASEMQTLIGTTGHVMSSVGPLTLQMSCGIYSGPCQFFLVGGAHRELVVTGPAATETIRLESEAAGGEIHSFGPGPDNRPEPYEMPSVPAGADLEQFLPIPLREQVRLAANDPEHRLVTATFLRFSGVGSVFEHAGLDGLLQHLEVLARLVDTTCAELGVAWLDADIEADGGKLYLVAGAPATTGEDEERTLRAVRRILDDSEGPLTLRAGINRGSAFCGDLGSESRRTYTVMGDTVNLAARLAARAEPGGMLATGDVLDRARSRYRSRSQSFLVKGKAQPITGYHVAEVIGRRIDEPREAPPLVGREAEVAILSDALTTARLRQQRVVEVVGEPGIGKSRLLDELRDRAGGFTVLEVHCDPYSSAMPYFTARSLLRPLAGIPVDADERAAGELLTLWVHAVMPELSPRLPLLAIPFGADVPATSETDDIDASFRAERLLDTVERFLTRVLVTPSLFVIEDIHWTDDSSLELFRHLVRQPVARPWLLCATRWPSDAALATDTIGHTLISLEPLGDDAARALALATAGELALSTEVLTEVRDRSGGNPFFVRELVEAARVAGSAAALPETVETLITSRIDTLAPDDRLLLRNASVLGARFKLGLLTEVLTDELHDIGDRERWDRLREFVAWEESGELRFVHDLYRAVAYEGMSFRRRRAMHARVGDALEQRESEPPLLSLHFFAAERYEKAWAYSTAAARSSAGTVRERHRSRPLRSCSGLRGAPGVAGAGRRQGVRGAR